MNDFFHNLFLLKVSFPLKHYTRTNSSLSTVGDSAVRVLYNFAVDNDFDFIWKGSLLKV